MANGVAEPDLAALSRRHYAELLVKGLPSVVNAVAEGARALLDKPSEHAQMQRRRDLVEELKKSAAAWHRGMVGGLRTALHNAGAVSRPAELPAGSPGGAPMALVDDDTIEREILSSRLALAMMDRANWEFTDLRTRLVALERRDELLAQDMVRAHVLARIVVDAWRAAGCGLESWREVQPVLHDEFALLVEEGYHECNRWLMERGVRSDVDLRPFIRRSRDLPMAPNVLGGTFSGTGGFGGTSSLTTPAGGYAGTGGGGFAVSQGGFASSSAFGPTQPLPQGAVPGRGGAPAAGAGASAAGTPGPWPAGGGGGGGNGGVGGAGGGGGGGAAAAGGSYGGAGSSGGLATADGRTGPTVASGRAQATGSPAAVGAGGGHRVGEETRLMTRSPPLRSGEPGELVLERLNRLVSRHVPAFGDASRSAALSPGLARAIEQAQVSIRQHAVGDTLPDTAHAGAPALLQELAQRKRALKQAAATPDERATIEIVALLFQSILTEERIPAIIRVWFARLQMPVLRVAVGEPDFFATIEHPARRLIDRMGACVMGFDSASRGVDDALEKEIKRVVQVVEAYPDTGRRVFQTVLAEFEKFLEHYFRSENEATRRGVSLAQQVEQRETLAIQYTIELRRMLNEVPVQEGVRQFLFQVWADVLATTAMRFGAASEQTKAMKRAASDLIWSAGAKVTREERAEVIRRLTPLLKSLRGGMASAGMDAVKQDEQIQLLNNSLAAAFTAKAAVIPRERLQELAERLETLEEMLPDAADVVIDESLVLDLSGHESAEFEAVAEGGSMPTPAMVAWARELQVGTWYMLDYRNRTEAVQLAWQGMRKQLSLFVTAQGRCVLFQQHRLASFLQAGLLLPAQDEALTVRATRDALAKLDSDPARLLS